MDKPIAAFHFLNEPFMAVVECNGVEPILCTPVVYDEPDVFGIGIIFNDEVCKNFGLIYPRDMITAWRATEIIRHFSVINLQSLSDAYFTASRESFVGMEPRVEQTISMLGQDVYDSIMSMPIPEKIIHAMFAEQGSDYPPDLYPITEEVRRGTLQWRQEFTDAGIEHPEVEDRLKQEYNELIAKYESLLISFSKFKQLARDCNEMKCVENILLYISELGFDKKCNDRLLVALAGIMGELAFIDSMAPPDNYPTDEQLYEFRNKSFESSADWLVNNPWRGIKYTKDSALQILSRYHDEVVEADQKANQK